MKPLTEVDFEIHILQDKERIKSFDCGDDDLNDFILNTAPLYKSAMLAETFVVEFNRFRKKNFPNEKRLKAYPAVKICRFAVDVSARNLHLGSSLIQYIKWKVLTEIEIGCRYLTVDAYLDAIPFYIKNDFNILTQSDEQDQHTRLLFFDMKRFISFT